jgi:hypothetical protein
MSRAVGSLGVQRRLDQLGHALVIDATRRAWPHIVVQTCDASLEKPCAPLAHRGVGQLQAPGDRAVGPTIEAVKDFSPAVL